MLYGRAAAAEHGETEHAAEDGDRDEDARKGEFSCGCVKYYFSFRMEDVGGCRDVRTG